MDFYYQIKGKRGPNDYSFSQWAFPPIFSGKVTANSKKEAKLLIDEQYGKNFPLRVLQKDLDSNEFLLSIEEIKEGSHIQRLFEPQTCSQCSKTFYVIDKYNDQNCYNKGFDYCSDYCKEERRQIEYATRNDNEALAGRSTPVIYKITNKNTGQVYIGKTTQVFTLRWYQHFFHHGNCKFHEAIKNSKVSDWTFEIQEIIALPDNIKSTNEMETYIVERERHWISHFNSINEGYNSKN